MKLLVSLLFALLSLLAAGTLRALDTNYVEIPISVEKSYHADYMALTIAIEVENKSYTLASDACNSLINRLSKQLEAQIADSGVVINLKSYNSLPQTFLFNEYFKVRSLVNILIRDKKALGQVLSFIRSSDTVKIITNNFVFRDYNLIFNDLIRLAAATARDRAKVYEESLGLKLDLVSFSETQFSKYGLQDRRAEYNQYSGGYANTLKSFEKQIEVLDNYPEKSFGATLYFKYRIIK